MTRKLTITAALPYANGPLHIGHLAGCYLPADIYARHMRSIGRDLVFVCGSDEHGVPITLKAKKEGTTPQKIVDRYHTIIKNSFEKFGISFDIYGRTSDSNHHEVASELFKNLYDKGEFLAQESEQYFDENENQFLADRYIVGTCPSCGFEGAYGDQCENCGKALSPLELINPKSSISGNKPILKKTKNWYLPLDKLQHDFLDKYIAGKTNWKNHVLGQCKSWLKEGLKPRAMTRDLNWGVPVPIDSAKGKVMYVWFDAPIGYISNTQEAKPNDWKEYWDKDAEIVHFVGKDNIVFHCLIFPAILYAHGNYGVASQVPANEFLNLEGDKISTSRNWAVWLHEYMEDLPNKEDELRYVLCSIMPETADSEFTWKDYQSRVNNELVSIAANFVNRVMVLSHKFCEGKYPSHNGFSETDKEVMQNAIKNEQASYASIEKYKFREGLQHWMSIARVGNKYLTEKEPWKQFKENPEAVQTTMAVCLEICKILGRTAQPYLPRTATKLEKMLNLTNWGRWDENHELNEASHLFSKIDDKEVANQLEKLEKSKAKNSIKNTEGDKGNDATQNQNTKPNIQFPDFTKLDLKIASIKAAEKVQGADKLLKIILEVDREERTVVSGIAEHYKPDEILGKQVLLLANLEPRKMRGVLSEGMILMAEDKGKLIFVSPESIVNSGSGVS